MYSKKYIGRLWTFSLPTHKFCNLLLLLKTPAGSFSIWFPSKLLQKGYRWILVGHFWNAFQSDNENYSAREPLQTKVVNDKSICDWWVNRDQTNDRFNFYWLLTRRPTRGCFWRLQLVSSLSGFYARFCDNIHIRFKMIFQCFLRSFFQIYQVHYHISVSFALD